MFKIPTLEPKKQKRSHFLEGELIHLVDKAKYVWLIVGQLPIKAGWWNASLALRDFSQSNKHEDSHKESPWFPVFPPCFPKFPPWIPAFPLPFPAFLPWFLAFPAFLILPPSFPAFLLWFPLVLIQAVSHVGDRFWARENRRPKN